MSRAPGLKALCIVDIAFSLAGLNASRFVFVTLLFQYKNKNCVAEETKFDESDPWYNRKERILLCCVLVIDV